MDLSDLAVGAGRWRCWPPSRWPSRIWALLDAARRPQWAWALTERRQVVWMAAIMFGTLTVIGGVVLCTWYLTKVRHEVAAAEDGQI